MRERRTEKSRGRKRVQRARVTATKRLSVSKELEAGELLYPHDEFEGDERPKTRGECANAQRPCPYVSCKHHLFLDINPETGSIKINFPDLEVWELKESCSLDVADRGGVTLETVGDIMNITRERVRQLEALGAAHVRRSDSSNRHTLESFADPGPVGKRRLPVLVESDGEEWYVKDPAAGEPPIKPFRTVKR